MKLTKCEVRDITKKVMSFKSASLQMAPRHLTRFVFIRPQVTWYRPTDLASLLLLKAAEPKVRWLPTEGLTGRRRLLARPSFQSFQLVW